MIDSGRGYSLTRTAVASEEVGAVKVVGTVCVVEGVTALGVNHCGVAVILQGKRKKTSGIQMNELRRASSIYFNKWSLTPAVQVIVFANA